MTHELKTHPEYFKAVMQGLKLFEVRKNDRDYKVDDILILREYEPSDSAYSGKSIQCKITYILDNPEYVKAGFIILGFVIIIYSEDVEQFI